MKRGSVMLAFAACVAAAVNAHAGLAEDAGRALDSMANLLADDMRGTKNAVTDAVSGARQTAARIWSDARSGAERAKADADGAVNGAKGGWEDYQRRWAARPVSAPVELNADFPELVELKSLSERYSPRLSSQLPEELKRRQSQFAGALARLDRKYRDSAAPRPPTVPDLSRFPDLQGLLRAPACEAAPAAAAVAAFDRRLGGWLALIQGLAAKYRNAPAGLDFSMLLRAGREAAKAPCADELQPLAGSALADGRAALAAARDAAQLSTVELRVDAPLWQGKLKEAEADRRALSQALERAAAALETFVAADVRTAKAGVDASADAQRLRDRLVVLDVGADPAQGKVSAQILVLAKLREDSQRLAAHVAELGNASAGSLAALDEAIVKFNEAEAQAARVAQRAAGVGIRSPALDGLIMAVAHLPKLKAPRSAVQGVVACAARNDPGVQAFVRIAAEFAAKDFYAVPDAVKHDLDETVRAALALSAALHNVESLTGVFVDGSCSGGPGSGGASCRAGSVGFALVKLDAALKADPAGVRFEAGVRLNLEAVPAAANAALKNGQDAAQALAGVGATADLLARQEAALMRAIDLSKAVPLPPELADAARAAPDPVELKAAGRSLDGAVACLQAKGRQAEQALGGLVGLLTYLKGLAGPPPAPAWLIERVGQCLATANEQAKVEMLIAKAGGVGRGAREYASAYAALMSSVVPLPKPEAPQNLQVALDRLQTLKQSIQSTRDAVPDVETEQNAVNTCAFYVKNSLAGGSFASDASTLSFEPLDWGSWTASVDQEKTAVEGLVGAASRASQSWTRRQAAYAARAAGAARAVDAELKRRIDGGLVEARGFVFSCGDAINSAVSHAGQLEGGLAEKQAAAVDKTVRDVRRDIDNVVWRLKPLIPPPLGTRSPTSGLPSESDLRSVIDAANQARDSAAHAADVARAAFERRIQQTRGWLQDDIAAVQDRSSRAKAKAQQVRDWLAAAPAP